MAPPSYADIGKQARDVFGKGYHFGLVKLDVKTKTTSGVEFNAGGTSADGKVMISIFLNSGLQSNVCSYLFLTKTVR
jgi:voltage-dependent anion channel protein 2